MDTSDLSLPKKKKPKAGLFAGLFVPRVYEFETPFTPRECYERLNKLPQRMTYLNAKHQVERVNTENNIDVRWFEAENRVEFGFVTINEKRSTEFVIIGEISYSEIYETILVRGQQPALFKAKRYPFLYNKTDDSVNVTLGVIYLCLFIIFCTFIWILIGFALTADEHHMLCLGTSLWIPIVAIFAFVIVPIFGDTEHRSRWRLIKIVLTEPDESKL